jgi:hypothetical protein
VVNVSNLKTPRRPHKDLSVLQNQSGTSHSFSPQFLCQVPVGLHLDKCLSIIVLIDFNCLCLNKMHSFSKYELIVLLVGTHADRIDGDAGEERVHFASYKGTKDTPGSAPRRYLRPLSSRRPKSR